MNGSRYCNSISNFSRFKTRIVDIGGVPLGGDHPIRIQSMTSTRTLDTKATVEQSIRMIKAGCEYVRIATPGIKEVENLRNIKQELKQRGYTTPLIADIHFNPEAAELAATIVEKVRINPGNYADSRKNVISEYTDSEYNAELERIRERVRPLIEICKLHGTALRVGSNHGSLSERIKNKYGNTPLGMVESALEFIRICENMDFHNLVVSMKSSNIKITVQATRLLVSKMMAEGMNYPVHLGVTEAGEGEDGRIKSAAGIGSLLADGIGDTIRVSLTEDPEKEIPVAVTLLQHYIQLPGKTPEEEFTPSYDPFYYKRRETIEIDGIGGSNPPVVITDADDLTFPNRRMNIRTFLDFEEKDLEKFKDQTTVLILEDLTFPNLPLDVNTLLNLKEKNLEKFNISGFRKAFNLLTKFDIRIPVILKLDYSGLSKDEFLLFSTADFSALHIDGFGDGIWLTADEKIPLDFIKETSLNILQANGTRISKAEYISCPSCGRTTYDIQKAVARIRAATSHLKGLKIGIMGCIVNGPGEMADAHYGYVGSGKRKISLYKGKDCVMRNIDEIDAVDALIELIKTEGDWVEP